ncbi:hypothetical protein FHN55_05075 [Streptomyces sp. NP160]|uniref:bifunctional DNA primase/polymerase n=1 Tax=Streptomyces sp. NP160 TaxID=2586637 RepID=UPI00111BC24A|nr:bifunctional DNA primase/polymerase [Streptomyces sp. NP160]TNM69158.1 hypothetical protein FHN55_05075 [Streptomyces sp. NP160]
MSPHADGERQPTPFADGAEDVYQSGLGSPFPLPPRCKAEPPRGITGAAGVDLSWPDILATIEDNPTANLGMRVADDVVGIDVDGYAGKQGAQTVRRAEGVLEPLPRTFTSTSRNDGVSGIRWFRVPPGTVLVGQLSTAGFGSHVEVIQHGHRYAVVAPSIHPEGRTYYWTGPDGVSLPPGVVPSRDDLPGLPVAWVEALSVDANRADLSSEVLAAPDGWPTAAHTHPYVTKLLAGIAEDPPRGEWHSWTFSRECKLAAAKRLGLITDVDLAAGQREVVARLFEALPTRGSSENPEREAGRCWRDAVERTARMTEDQARDSLGLRPMPDEPAWEDSGVPLDERDTPHDPASIRNADTLTEQQDDTTESPSWGRIDLTAYLDGTHKPQEPELLRRTDGRALLYAGRVHSFHGESESGKSWAALVGARDVLADGRRVVMLDYESDAGTVVGRLLGLGVKRADIAERFDYRRPEVGPNTSRAEQEAWFELLRQPADLVILDGVTEALATIAATSTDNDEVTRWVREVARRLAQRTGGAVVMVDHVTKNADTRGRFAIGGQAKMSALDGAAYVVEVVSPLGVGMRGSLALRVAKDRGGRVRPYSGTWRKSDRTQETAVLTIDSTNPGRIVATLDPPRTDLAQPAESGGDTFRPTTLMQRVSQAAQNSPEPLSRNSLANRAGGNRSAALKAVELLEAEGYLVADGPARNGGGNTLRSAKPYAGDAAAKTFSVDQNGSTSTHPQDPTRTSSRSRDRGPGTGTENGSNPYSGTGENGSGTGPTPSASRAALLPALSGVDLTDALGEPCSSCSQGSSHRADCSTAASAA